MKPAKTYARGEPMPVADRGSKKLLRKADRLHPMTFDRAYRRLLKAEQKGRKS